MTGIHALKQKVESFFNQRCLQIKQGNGAYPLTKQDCALILHITPLLDFENLRCHNLNDIEKLKDLIGPLGTNNMLSEGFWNFDYEIAYNYERNEDGYLVYVCNKRCCSYTKVFLNGTIESVFDNFKIEADETEGIDKKIVSFDDLKDILIRTTDEHMMILRRLSVTNPILLRVSFLGMAGVSLTKTRDSNGIVGTCFLENEIQLPSTEFNMDLQSVIHYHHVIGDQLTHLWNKVCSTSPEFDKNSPPEMW